MILRPKALPISGSFPAPKIIIMMIKMTINSGKPIPIIIHTLQVFNNRFKASNSPSTYRNYKIKIVEVASLSFL
uniref:Uncharacterized protein n=1 Tax=uncultured marine Nitrospinaceae bacterium TaxID=482920 RepID=A4GJ10_9BACT|nr:hypothetical protein [uncultured marine Nitrospinaceae bacterium]